MRTSMATRKFFLCTGQWVTVEQLANYPYSHIVGELRYALDEYQSVSVLAVYENSLPSNIIPPTRPDVRVEIIGDARRIRCTISYCEHFNRWEIGRSAFLQLSRRYEHYFEKGE